MQVLNLTRLPRASKISYFPDRLLGVKPLSALGRIAGYRICGSARWPVWWISAHEYRGRYSQACTRRRQTPIAAGSPRSQVTSGHCWRTCMVVANNVQTRSNGLDDRGQPLVTMGGGALPLPMPTQPETLT